MIDYSKLIEDAEKTLINNGNMSFDENLSLKRDLLKTLTKDENKKHSNIECYMDFLIKNSGCVEDFQILEILSNEMIELGLLSEEAITSSLSKSKFGRWS